MKKIVSALFMALFCLVSGVMSAQTDKVVRILSIGNSFSEDAVEQHLHDIAVADGKEVIIGNTYLPKGMTPEQRLAAQKSAHAAVKKPNRVTIIK